MAIAIGVAQPSPSINMAQSVPSENLAGPSTQTSASTLLRTLKSNQSSHSERIAVARQALLEAKVPRVQELVRQWVLDEWLAPSKGIIQKEYHELFAEVSGPSESSPFAIISRCFSELGKYQPRIASAPVRSLRTMIASHVQTTSYARWVELWTGLITWLAGEKALVGASDEDLKDVESLGDEVFRHVMESTDIVHAEASSTQQLTSAIPYLATVYAQQPSLSEHIITAFAEMLRSLPSDSLDQFLLPSFASRHAHIAHLLPFLLRSMAETRARSRYTIFSQPTSSKVAYETHIAQSLHEALYKDFSQAMGYLDGIAALGGVSSEAVWTARLGCWEELRRLDVRIEGVERWRLLVVETSRSARVLLNSNHEGLVKISLKVLACLSVLDYSAAGISDDVPQRCLQTSYISSTEGTDLLLALLHHHQLIRAPVTFVELLCRCLSTASPNSPETPQSSSANISSSFIQALSDLITYSAETQACWRVLISTSEDLLSRPADQGLTTFANLLSALLVSGCPDDIINTLKEVWAVKVADIPATGKSKTSKRDRDDQGAIRLGATLTVRSALKGEAEADVIEGLKAVMKDKLISKELDLAICRYLLSISNEIMSDTTIIDSLLDRLSPSAGNSPYWKLLTTSVQRRLNTYASESQLLILSELILEHQAHSQSIWTSTTFWELSRLSGSLLSQLSTDKSTERDIGFAIPHSLQSVDLVEKYVQGAGSEGYSVEKVKMWLEQVNVESLNALPASLMLEVLLNQARRDLCRVIVIRLLQSSSSKFPDAVSHLVQAMRDHTQAHKPTLQVCGAMMEIIELFTRRKWTSLSVKTQEDLSIIAVASNKALGKAIKKSETADAEAKARLWLALNTYRVWSGNAMKLVALPPTLHHSLMATPSSSSGDLTLPLRLVASQSDSTSNLIAMYIHIRQTGNTRIIDDTMSQLIQSFTPEVYTQFWQYARLSAEGGGPLPLLISTDREGSGKVVKNHLGPILANLQSKNGNPEVLSALWHHRAILFDEGQAIDSWLILSGLLLSFPTLETTSSLLDAATSFAQQRSDLLPATSYAITTTICSIFTYLRGRSDTSLATKIARFLDSLGRTAASISSAKRKRVDTTTSTRQTLTRAMARHVPVILIAYARAATDPTRNISAVTRRIVDPSLAELCMSTDAATGKAFDSTGIPYGLGEGLAGEAESAVWAQIWRSWKKKRYTGQG